MNSITTLSSLGILQISGNDAARFLQGQTTCDVLQIAEQQIQCGAFCNPQGRIIANFRIFKWQNNFYLLLAQELITPLIEHIKKYAVFFKCILQDVSEEWKIYGVFGENLPPFTADEKNILLSIPGQQARCIFLTSEERSLDPGSASLTLLDRDDTLVIRVDESHWKLADIQDGFALIHTETSGLFTPHDINLPQLGGVSFNKGCYTGQEIVARMQYLGKLKQQLQRIKISTAQNIPLASNLLVDDQIVGQLVDGVIVDNCYEGLAVIRNDALEKKITLLGYDIVIL